MALELLSHGDVGPGSTGDVPPDFANNKKCPFIFRKCPLSLKEKVFSKCRAPKFEMLPMSLFFHY